MTTRRGFLGAVIAASAAPRLGWAAAGSPAYLGAARERSGDFALLGIDQDGQITFSVPLPARGHAGAGHPTRAEAVAFARRPGTFALVLDCVTGRVRHHLAPPEGRHFNGHGVFAAGGALLLTSEQRTTDSLGVIGAWDVTEGYRRIGEYASGGTGPHDIRLLQDGSTLVVANGGIATDPTDRSKLNLPTMRPNLTYLDLAGSIIEQVELEPQFHKNSIRHLAIGSEGLVAFAMQWEGAPDVAPPLLGLHRRGTVPTLVKAPLGDELAMQGYAGSIAFSGDRREVAITSPRGGRLHRFSAEGDFLGVVSRADVCGLASRPEGYMASDGLGGLISVTPDGPNPLARFERAWDNHLVAL